MGLTGGYAATVLAMYPDLVLRDPDCDAEDEDHGQARRRALDTIVAANRYQAFIHVAQTAVPVAIRLQLWDEPPPATIEDQWDDRRHIGLHCPSGRLLVENTTAGSVALHPGPVRYAALPGGSGVFDINVFFAQRDVTARAVMAAFVAHHHPSPALEQALARLTGQEHYLVQVWRTGPLPPDDIDEDDDDDQNRRDA